MCGIAGIMEYASGRAVRGNVLDAMNATLVHRGPDDAGRWSNEHVGIAMRRLSIVDVAHGHQPISNDAGDCHIVFNGEIYNHRELRRGLEQRGHRFRTAADTEVILRLYEEKGEAAIRELDGMFAIAIVDLRDGPQRPKLLLARDRLGKKPLYYADRGGTLIFGSELKAVMAHGGVSREIDLEALHHYLSLMVIPEPFSIYRDVRKLPAGCILACSRDGVQQRRYWSYGDVVGERREDPKALVHDVRELLFAAVKKRLDLEVPFGAFLSGGLDSASVVAVMSQILTKPVKTFSIGFEGPASHDERPLAALTARHLGTEHHELLARPEIVGIVHELVQYADEPLAISSSIPLLLLAREARKSVKVVFTGDGGDEVFGGYGHYQFERWAKAWRRLPSVIDRGVLAAARHAPLFRTELARATRFVKNSRGTHGARRLGWASGFSDAEKHELCPGGWDHPSTPSLLESRVAAFDGLSVAGQANALDMLLWLPDEMLAKVDRMTMASSLEARSPLLDDALVARLAGVSFDDKLPRRPGAPAKPLLRNAIADLLPPHLLGGKKWGFNVPLDDWFRGAAAPFVDATLSPQRIASRGIFDPGAVSRLVAAQRDGRIQASNRLFALIVFEVWAEHHL